jgi:hypothetical protein
VKGPGFFRSLAALLALCGIVLLAPFVVLLLGLPIALALRALVEVGGWAMAALGG